MGVAVRGIDDIWVVAVDALVEPDVLRDDIGGGVFTGGIEAGLGGGGGGSSSGGDGERVDRIGGGSISDTGISEISPAPPSSKGDNVEGGGDDSIVTPFRKGELVRNGEVLCRGEAARRALAGGEDICVCDERNGDERASRNGIRLNVDAFRLRGGDFCVGSGGLEDELGPGSALEDGPGCGSGSTASGSS